MRDGRGRITSVSDAAGTRSITYTADGQMQNETFLTGLFEDISINQGHDGLLRRDSFTVTRDGDPLMGIGFGYDAASRLETVASSGVVATYSRLANSGMLGDTTFTMDAAPAMTTSRSHDALNRVTGITNAPQAGGVQSFTYLHDAASRRERITHADGAYWQFAYNDRSEVVGGAKFLDGGTPVSGMSFGYGFDGIGNRVTTTTNSRTSTYTPNNVNQYTARTFPGAADIFGRAHEDADVQVNGQPSTRQNEFFHAEVTGDNPTSPVFLPTEIEATHDDETTTITGNIFLPETPEEFTYDADGNLTLDGRWHYEWDGNNRLIRMTTREDAIDAGAPGRRLSFGYDYMGRRISKLVEERVNDEWRFLHERGFVYDGWNLIAELFKSQLSGLSLLRTYAWGEDLSGSMQGAGGIGGLLAIHDHIEEKTFLPAYDANGNVASLIDAGSGAIAATYEYDPFGNLLAKTGAYALANPFRFSTKYTDNETNLAYYGHRYLLTETGRWISRDPIEEQGGVNLYGFVGNDGVNRWDYLGHQPILLHSDLSAFGEPSSMYYMVEQVVRTWNPLKWGNIFRRDGAGDLLFEDITTTNIASCKALSINVIVYTKPISFIVMAKFSPKPQVKITADLSSGGVAAQKSTLWRRSQFDNYNIAATLSFGKTPDGIRSPKLEGNLTVTVDAGGGIFIPTIQWEGTFR